MTSYGAPERLLALGTACTRHHDALSGLLHGGNRALAVEEMEYGVVDSCSPWACRGEVEPVRDDFGLAS
ncbi:hypothetical protein EJC51_18520 [Streptomyces aquilus]|uniref:Uncharacterized protein n=1 Tax=Streptomyces aquilus TaxID=2548456 RepID=A0A3Q9C077_9ACTN|nr:hypothetical protein [Streptomyces aquilus]AZP17908.1 hypothetical protein EJC51_18520 [Streptomyces aquilus]